MLASPFSSRTFPDARNKVIKQFASAVRLKLQQHKRQILVFH